MAAALKQLEEEPYPHFLLLFNFIFPGSSILHMIKSKAQGWQNGSVRKSRATQIWQPEFKLQDPHDIRRNKLTAKLTSDLHMCTPCRHAHTVIIIIKKNLKPAKNISRFKLIKEGPCGPVGRKEVFKQDE